MKNIRKFKMAADKEAAVIEEYSVSYVTENDKVYTTPENGGQSNGDIKNYMRFVAIEDSQINLTAFNFDTGEADTSVDLKHSKDGVTWVQYDFNPIPLAAGETLYLKGNNENGLSGEQRACTFGSLPPMGIPNTPSTGKFECHGNIMSLLYGDEFEDKTSIPGANCFDILFGNCTSLTTAPELPATTLADDCYQYMFSGCTSLTTAPSILPATTLANGCYTYMFENCTSLTTAPELPATTLAQGCYMLMFECCTSLTIAPELPATTLAVACYNNMFSDCTNLIESPELPATTLAPLCYYHMFWGCTNLSKITMLATDITAEECLTMWTGMIDDETGEEVSGVAPTGVFVKNVEMENIPIGNQENRFSGIPEGWVVEDYKLINECTSLTITADDVSANQTRTKIYYTAVGNYRDENGVLVEENITVTGQAFSDTFPMNDSYTEDVIREISFTYLGVTATTTITQYSKSYYNKQYLTLKVSKDAYVRFTSAVGPESLMDEISTPYEYSYDGISWMPYDDSEIHLTSGQQISWKGYYEKWTGNRGFVVYEKDEYGYQSNGVDFIAYGNVMSLLYGDEFYGKTEIPEGCGLGDLFSGSCLIDASNLILPATTLTDYCYKHMFAYCTSLTTAPELPATTLALSCYYGMFVGCTNLTTTPELPATTLTQQCYQYMFNSCTNLNHITMLAMDISAADCLNDWVNNVSSTGTFIKSCEAVTLPIGSEGIPSGWTIENAFECEIVSLSITADNVEFYMTSTTIHYESVVNLYNKDGEVADTITLTGTTQSESFPENTSETDIVERTISFTFYGKTATTTITQGKIIPYYTDYTTFEALEDGTFSFTKNGTGDDIQYSKDNGTTWTSLASGESVSVVTGDKVMWKSAITPSSSKGIGTFSSSNNFNVYGNIMSLLYRDEFNGLTSLEGKDYAFKNLFNKCSKMIDASNLILPATTLADNCYESMFYNCTSLTTAPELPATTLADKCYYCMFDGCTSLTTAPELPATTLADNCYESMFGNCTSLTTAPELPATTLAKFCYSNMFYTCTSLTTAPELPALELADNCYQNMFWNCTSLTTAPELPAKTLANYCYQNMFRTCTSLYKITMLATDISASSCLQSWVYGVSSTGTFVKHPNMTSLPTGTSGIPTKWTVEDAVI